jgi:hypothetical protein
MRQFLGDLSEKGNWPAFVFMTVVFTSIGIALDAGTGHHVPTWLGLLVWIPIAALVAAAIIAHLEKSDDGIAPGPVRHRASRAAREGPILVSEELHSPIHSPVGHQAPAP